MTAAASAGERLLAFRAGGRRFVMPASHIREVSAIPTITPVPHAPASLMGIGTVRGEATAILSAATLLGLNAGKAQRLILLDSDQPTALAIDKVEAVIDEAVDLDRPDFGTLIATAFPARSAKMRGGSHRTAATKIVAVERLDILAFAIGDQLFALSLDDIIAVERMPRDIARLPHGDPATVGTVAWRETSLPLLSLPVLLDLPARDGADNRIVVVRVGGQPLGLVVDAIHALIRPFVDRIDPVSTALLRGEGEAVIQAIYRPADGGRLISILSAGQLLRSTPQLATSSAPSIVDGSTRKHASTEALLLVTCGDHRLAFPLDVIREVARMPARPTSVPGTPSFIAGVIGHRGLAVPVVDLPAHLSDRPGGGAKARLLVVSIAGAEAALLVDAVDGVVRVDVDAIANTPLAENRTQVTGRTVSLDDGATASLIVSPGALFEQVEADLIAGLVKRSVIAS